MQKFFSQMPINTSTLLTSTGWCPNNGLKFELYECFLIVGGPCICIASHLAESEPYCCSGCLYVCLSVGHSATYSLPRLTDHNQIWHAGTYLSSDPCKPFWTPCPPYFGSQGQKYANFRLRTTLNGYHFNIRTQIQKSRRESTRMLTDSIVPKYQKIPSGIVGRVGF